VTKAQKNSQDQFLKSLKLSYRETSHPKIGAKTTEKKIDNRPHFEVLGDKYKNNDPSSEEEIWIPIRKK
jgi:predicted transcriptional regulator YdeE